MNIAEGPRFASIYSDNETAEHHENPDATVHDVFMLQAQKPPGGDKIIGACYKKLVNLISTDVQFSTYIDDLYRDANTPPSAFVNRFFRVLQYDELLSNPNYPKGLYHPKDWENKLRTIVEDEAQRKNFSDFFLSHETTTTKSQRYIGPQACMVEDFGSKPVAVADLGCGVNAWLPRLSAQRGFQSIIDNTGKVESLLNEPINLIRGIAVDKENPNTEEAKRWNQACRNYPEELLQSSNVENGNGYHDIKDSRINFIQGNILNLDQICKRNSLDVAVLSTVMYMYFPHDQERIIDAVKSRLKKNGKIYINDFVELNPKAANNLGLNFLNDWGQSYSYATVEFSEQTLWKPNVRYRFKTPRCSEVKLGEGTS